MGNQIQRLLVANCPQLELSSAVSGEGSISYPSLPLQCQEELTKWDTFLSDGINLASAVSIFWLFSEHFVFGKHILIIFSFQVTLLADYGCNDLKDTVYNIMRKLMSNKLASDFNLRGMNKKTAVKEKKKFKDTPSYNIILGMVYCFVDIQSDCQMVINFSWNFFSFPSYSCNQEARSAPLPRQESLRV